MPQKDSAPLDRDPLLRRLHVRPEEVLTGLGRVDVAVGGGVRCRRVARVGALVDVHHVQPALIDSECVVDTHGIGVGVPIGHDAVVAHAVEIRPSEQHVTAFVSKNVVGRLAVQGRHHVAVEHDAVLLDVRAGGVGPKTDAEGAFVASVEQADGFGLSVLVVVEKREIDLAVHGRYDFDPQLVCAGIVAAAVVIALRLFRTIVAVHLVLVVHDVARLSEVVVADRAGQAVLGIILGIQPRVYLVFRQGRRRIAEIDENHQPFHHARRMRKKVAWQDLVLEDGRVGLESQVRPRRHLFAFPYNRRVGSAT